MLVTPKDAIGPCCRTLPTKTRLNESDATDLYMSATLHELGSQASGRTGQLHPEQYRTYVVDRNINYANWCTAKCIFCNFKADPPEMKSGRTDQPAGYTL